MSTVGDIWYRADERYIDDGSEMYVGVTIAVVEWHVVRVTPQGVWLNRNPSYGCRPRWASEASRSFAATRVRAVEKLIKRRQSQVRILGHQLQVARDTLDAAKALRETMQ